MDESDVRLRLHHALWWRGWHPYHYQDGRVVPCNKCNNKILVVPRVAGRSDTIARHYTINTPQAYIEVKAVREMAFAFSQITDEQREYLSARANSYLCLGKIVPAGSKTTIHSIYVVPWMMWLEWETSSMILGKKSIPYSYELYENKVKTDQTDLVNRMPPFCELLKHEGDWHLHDSHPLAIMPEVDVPFYKREKE